MTNKNTIENYKWTLFYVWISNGKYYEVPMLIGKDGRYYLGGSPCGHLLFRTRAEAENEKSKIKKSGFNYYQGGDIFVKRFEIKPIAT